MKNLVEITSKVQKRNRTICYFDLETLTKYTSHKNGYVRRVYYMRHWSGKVQQGCYPINRRDCFGNYIRECSEAGRLELIMRGVENFRKTCKKNQAKYHIVNPFAFKLYEKYGKKIEK